MAKKKATVYVEVFEAALRRYLGFELLDRVWARSDLDEDEAMALADEAKHATRP